MKEYVIKENALKENALKGNAVNAHKQNVLSLFIGFPTIHIVEMAAYHRFDAVVLDNEHGMLSDENIEHMVIAAELAGVKPLVRVPSSDAVYILKAMDRGAHGVHVPQVETKEQALEVVAAVKYPPLGRRGAAFSMRAARYGTIPIAEYLREANRRSFIAIHIESERALENVDAILEVEGIDLVYIGPTDLSVSLGYEGQVDHPQVIRAAEKIRDSAKKRGLSVGMHVKSAEGAKERFRWGADYVGITVTSLINGALSDYVRQARGEPL